MKCEDCGSEMLPTGAMLAGHPCVACPNCSPDFIKQKIRKHAKFMHNVKKNMEKMEKDVEKIEGLVNKGHAIISLDGIVNKFKYYVLGYVLISDVGDLLDETKRKQ